MSLEDYHQLHSLLDKHGHFDRGDVTDSEKDHKTIWDNAPESRDKLHKIDTKVQCVKCHKQIDDGYIVLDRERNHLQDSSKFMIVDDGIVCDQCINIRGGA